MEQEIIEAQELKVMTVGEAQREQYQTTVAKFKAEAPKILANIKSEEGCNKAAAWRIQIREFTKSVETGVLGVAQAFLNKHKKAVDAEIRSYVDPCDALFKEAKAKMDRWYLDESQRIQALHDKAKTKAIDKAEVKQQQVVQTLMDLGKPKQAMIAASRPLAVALPTTTMPKIKGAIWKKKFVVQINDIGVLLAYIAKNPKYHRLIDQEVLQSRLETLALSLDGNMNEFKGIQCSQTPDSAVGGGPR
jgi:hypothetical protein